MPSILSSEERMTYAASGLPSSPASESEMTIEQSLEYSRSLITETADSPSPLIGLGITSLGSPICTAGLLSRSPTAAVRRSMNSGLSGDDTTEISGNMLDELVFTFIGPQDHASSAVDSRCSNRGNAASGTSSGFRGLENQKRQREEEPRTKPRSTKGVLSAR